MKACMLVLLFSCVGCCAQTHGQKLAPVKGWKWLDFPPSENRISVTRLRHKPSIKAISAFERGYQHACHQDAWQAATEFERAVTLDPEFSEAHCNLGVQYISLGHLDKAAAHFTRAIELDATTSIYHSNLAFVLARLHEYERGKMEAQTALALDASSALAHYILGWEATRRSQNLDEAIAHLEYAASKIPEAHYVLAIAWGGKGEFRSARKEMEVFLKSSRLPRGRQDIDRWMSALVPK